MFVQAWIPFLSPNQHHQTFKEQITKRRVLNEVYKFNSSYYINENDIEAIQILC